MTYQIDQDSNLLEALQTHFPESSRRTHQNWVKWGRVLVDGTVQKRGNAPVTSGQTLSLDKKESTHAAFGIPIIYQDRWIVVIDKPAGILSVPAEREEINAFHMLKAALKTPSLFPVHRLDQDTSGVLVFARSKLVEEQLNALFEKHDLQREYLAIVDGRIPEPKGTWECYLREKENYDVEVTTEEFGRKAITHYEVVRYSTRLTYLRFKLETGRKHQIRVQAAHLGYPIVGDKRYGSLINPFKRMCLHAFHLGFIHPMTQKPMTFTSLPKPGTNAFPFPLPSP